MVIPYLSELIDKHFPYRSVKLIKFRYSISVKYAKKLFTGQIRRLERGLLRVPQGVRPRCRPSQTKLCRHRANR